MITPEAVLDAIEVALGRESRCRVAGCVVAMSRPTTRELVYYEAHGHPPLSPAWIDAWTAVYLRSNATAWQDES